MCIHISRVSLFLVQFSLSTFVSSPASVTEGPNTVRAARHSKHLNPRIVRASADQPNVFSPSNLWSRRAPSDNCLMSFLRPDAQWECGEIRCYTRGPKRLLKCRRGIKCLHRPKPMDMYDISYSLSVAPQLGGLRYAL
ncbi:hypothetical protein BDR04DRAFT_1092851 [Suillus decipiens]|nr:hypothetical protein BDR04DRAFT_1092851 [Suillus decipiens]